MKFLLSLFLSIATAITSLAQTPGSILSQLGARGVTDHSDGTTNYRGYLVLLGSNGVFDASVMPTSSSNLSGTALTQLYYVDINGVDATYAGTPSLPFKTLAYAVSRINTNAVIVFSPGTYSGATVTNIAVTKLTLIGSDPGLTYLSSLNLANSNQPVTVDVSGIHINSMAQQSGLALTLNGYNRAIVDNLSRSFTSAYLTVVSSPDATMPHVAGISTTNLFMHYAPLIGYIPSNVTNWDYNVTNVADALNQISAWTRYSSLTGAVYGPFTNTSLQTNIVGTTNIKDGAVTIGKLGTDVTNMMLTTNTTFVGDVIGLYNTNMVVGIRRVAIPAFSASDSNVLVYSSSTTSFSWQVYPGVGSVTNWSKYRAIQLVDMNTYGLTNVGEFTLNGHRITNWNNILSSLSVSPIFGTSNNAYISGTNIVVEFNTNIPTSGAAGWSGYPATQNVDIANKEVLAVSALTLNGVRRTTWPAATGGDSWSGYPATQDVNMANKTITNVAGITLGGSYRTNWPGVIDTWAFYYAITNVVMSNFDILAVKGIELGGGYRTTWPADGATGAAATISVAWSSNGAPGTAVLVTNVGNSNAASFGFIIPVGSNGPAATIDIAWTSNSVPGTPAWVTNVGNSSAASFGFIIPAGSNGLTGATGATGSAATINVAWSSNGIPGSSVLVTNIGNSNAANLGFIIPVGSNGIDGAAATINVAWSSNSAPGTTAWVTNVGNSNAASFGFIIPVGSNGLTGPTGTAATISIAWTSNSVPGSSAWVTNVGNSNAAELGFIIPAGSNGASGDSGRINLSDTGTNLVNYSVVFDVAPKLFVQTYTGATNVITYEVISQTTSSGTFVARNNSELGLETNTSILVDWATAGSLSLAGRGTTDVSIWSYFPAQYNVDMDNKTLTNVKAIALGGVNYTNWPPPTNWALYPARTNVDFSGYYLTNISAISLGIDNVTITSWPTAVGWSGYPATNTVNVGTNSILFGGVARTNWPMFTNGEWSSQAATTTVNLANNGITNVTSITLGGETRTNWPASYATLHRYFANTNVGEIVEVFATTTNIIATRTNSTFYINIPADTRLLSMKVRVAGTNTDSGSIYLHMGTNDMNNSDMDNMWVPVATCFKESPSAPAVVVLTVRPYVTDPTLILISGMSDTPGTMYNCRFNY